MISFLWKNSLKMKTWHRGKMTQMITKTRQTMSETSEYIHILKVLGVVLVEIRGTENLKKARILADIFHNVPALISSEKTHDEIIEEIMRRAEMQNAKEVIEKYLEAAT